LTTTASATSRPAAASRPRRIASSAETTITARSAFTWPSTTSWPKNFSIATTAIVKALIALEIEDENVFLKASRHVQMEPTWGGSQDVAVELRCESTAALVRMNSRKMWEPLVHLLADKDPQARATAGRALGATGSDKAVALLQFKILIGDKEPSVMSECFGSILALTKSIELVEPFLLDRNEGLAEAAAIALGESRLPAAFEALRDARHRGIDEHVLLLAIAMSRHPEAIDYLLNIRSEAAIEALAMYRNDSAVREKVREIVEASPDLAKAFAKFFGA